MTTKTFNTPFAKETGFSDQDIKTIHTKLLEHGENWNSDTEIIKVIFANVVNPVFCLKVIKAVRLALWID